jgi:hypothetical protein
VAFINGLNLERKSRISIALKILFFISALALFSPAVFAQNTTTNYDSLKNTIILVIRHAEKPDSGYDLTPAGYKRADAYAGYFTNYTVETKPFKPDYLFASTDSKGSHRPRLTLEPLAKATGLKIDTSFKSKDFKDLVDAIHSKFYGKQIVICWHHEAIPQLVQALGADPKQLFPDGEWPDDTYNWVIQLRFGPDGQLLDAKRINENLMPDDKGKDKQDN